MAIVAITSTDSTRLHVNLADLQLKVAFMRLKSLLSGTAAAMVALTASQLVMPSPATAATGHFVRFSNKNPSIVKWCVEAQDKNSKRIKIDCDLVPVRHTSTFVIPGSADHVAASAVKDSGLGEVIALYKNLSKDRDWCYRYTFSGTLHEATDKPCKQ